MMQNHTTNQQGNSQTTDPDYVPHDPVSDDLDTATIETEGEQDTPGGGDKADPKNAPDNADSENDPGDDSDPDADPDADPASTDRSVFMFGDNEFKPDEPRQESEREKALRVELEQLRGKQKDNPPPAENLPELKEPDLYDSGIEGDQQKYDAAMREYYKEVGKREAAAERDQQEQETRRQAEHAIIEQNVKVYGQRMAQVKATLPDIDAADDMLGRELPQLHQTALFSSGVENPELVAYALYKNKELREKFKNEKNPFRLGLMIGDISKKAKLAPEGKKPQLNKEPKPKGSQGAHPNKYGLTGDLADAIIE